MSQLRLNRRVLLRGAGSVALALPWLEAMAPERPAQAAVAPAKRFVGVYTPGGTVLSNWRPTGSENSFALSPILQPLAPVKEQVLVVDGVNMTCAVGEQNQSGLIALLTGTSQTGAPENFANGPSVDQVLASRLSRDLRLPSLELAVRWGTGKAHGLVSPIDILSFADQPNFAPIAPRLDPVQIWQDLFGTAPSARPDQQWDKSILDAVAARYAKLAKRVGAADRARLEQHATRIREIEQQLSQVTACQAPTLVDTSDYNPASGLDSGDSGQIKDPATDAAIPRVGKLMLDMLVMALACDITSVATLMWSDTEAKHTFPWLGLNEHLRFYMNDGGYQPAECTTIFTWYHTQHAYLLQQLAQTPAAAGTLLDDTLVFFGSHLQNPANYEKTDMPFLVAGGGGGLRTNRWLQTPGASHNDFLVSLLNLCGDPRTSFGAAQFCTGPLRGLT
ncbi:MAG: DUF1552 domain-containing protein [Myxococcales bacterium]